MSQQIQITGGAKVRNLEGVLTGTSGVVNALAINVPNGIPQLDGSGKILVSQLPNSVMEYKGTWDASTNTPTLVNGTGNQGDVYLCNVAGTVNFGAGPIAFFVGDQVIYSGTIWQRASGASGTVTSVAVTESGDALTITGSPITTSGTINIGFAGSAGQYINGAGSLTTFPSLTGYVPYTGATGDVDLGTFNLTADVITGATGSFTSNGGSNTFSINHSSGAGIALNITKGGSGEGLYINKTSGSGNAATIVGTLNATTLVKSGGTSSQFLKADGSVDSSTYLTTSAAASTYVPYTGATASVDLGANNLTAFGVSTKAIELTGNGTQGGYLYIKQGILPFGSLLGSNAITADANKFVLVSNVDGVNIKLASFDLGSLTTNVTRNYTLPDASGTLALLEGMQTFTGSKIFSNTTLVNTIYIDGVSYLKHLTSTSYITGYTTYSAKANGVIEYFFPSSFKSVLDFNDAADYTYTFPTASGTIALTSNLSSYVPYSGATTDLNLGLFNLFSNQINTQALDINTIGGGNAPIIFYMSSVVKASISASTSTLTFSAKNTGGFQFQNPSNAIIFSISNTGILSNGTYSYTLPSATGTLALGTGTTNYVSKWTGTNTIGNSLIFDNGTNVGIGTTSPADLLEVKGGNIRLSAIAGVGPQFNLYSNGQTSNHVTLAQGFALATDNIGYLYNRANADFVFGTNNTERMRISATGAATFSSSVMVNGSTVSNEGLSVQYNQAKTYTPQTAVSRWHSNEASGSQFKLNLFAIGNATSSSRVFKFQTSNEGVANDGIIAFQPDGGNVGIGNSGASDVRLYVKSSTSGASAYACFFRNSSSANLFFVRDDGYTFTGLASGSPYNYATTGRSAILDAGGGFGYLVSTRESKANIESIRSIDFINQLNPVSFNYRKKDNINNVFTDEVYDNITYGFIADEVEKVNKELVFYNEDGTLAGVEYNNMIAILTKAIQEQTQLIIDLKARLDNAGL
jgi:hypothetical protein